MGKQNDFQQAFVAGVKRLLSSKWGSQTRLAKDAGIKPSYLCDILNNRKKGTEKTRKSIAKGLGKTYQEVLNNGFNSLRNVTQPYAEVCNGIQPFTEDYACLIYQFAAKEVSLEGSHFFTHDSLKKIRPPGWVDYLNQEISEDALYEIAKKEMERIRIMIKKKTG